jgi:hypothetical protein
MGSRIFAGLCCISVSIVSHAQTDKVFDRKDVHADSATLHYSVTVDNKLPLPLIRDRIRAEAAEDSTPDYSQIDSQAKALDSQRSQEYDVTFSYGPDFLYYDQRQTSPSPSESREGAITVLYNGKATFTLLRNTLYIADGKDFHYVEYFPIFGSGVAGEPLVLAPGNAKPVRSGKAPNNMIFGAVFLRDYLVDGFAKYVQGYAKESSSGAVTELLTFDYLYPSQKIDFSDYEEAKDFSLAKQAMVTLYYVDPKSHTPTHTVDTQSKLKLLSSNGEAMDFHSSQLLPLINENGPVFLHAQVPMGHPLKFSMQNADIRKYFVEDNSASPVWLSAIGGLTIAGVATTLFALRRSR